MEGKGGPASVAEALRRLQEQASRDAKRQASELEEVDQELEGTREAIANLQKQLETLAQYREDLAAKQAESSGGSSGAEYGAIVAVLNGHAAVLAERASELAAASATRDADQANAISDPGTQKLLAEYEGFKTTLEPTLANIPESYREAMLATHRANEAKLKETFAKLERGPVESRGKSIAIDVVYSVDAPEGAAELVMFILPVRAAVSEDWRQSPDTVELTLAARVLESLYRACQELNYAHAKAAFGGFEGLLAVELELPGGDPEQWGKVIDTHLSAVLGGSPELAAGKIAVSATRVLADHLFPPDDGDTEAEA